MKKKIIIGIGICLLFGTILWSKNESKSFQGEFYRLSDAKACTLVETESYYQTWCNCATTSFCYSVAPTYYNVYGRLEMH